MKLPWTGRDSRGHRRLIDGIETHPLSRRSSKRGGVKERKKSVKASKLAERTGIEPATPGVTGQYSNHLNYRSYDLCWARLVGVAGLEPATYGL